MQEGHRLGNGFLHALLRQGQVHTAQGVKRLLQEVVRKAKRLGHVLDLRLDAGYTDGATLDYLQAESWQYPQRVLLVIIDRPDPKTGQLKLLLAYFFLAVGWQAEELDGPAALEHYRQRGTFDDRLGE